MTPRQRLITAIERRAPDRLPVTTHHLMPSFLEGYMGGLSSDQFFDRFGLDPIRWIVRYRPDPSQGQYFDPHQGEPGFLETRRVCTEAWRFSSELLPDPDFRTIRYRIITPGGTLTTVLQSNEHTTWVREHLVKEKKDIDLIERFAPIPVCDVEEINRASDEYGTRGLVRGHLPTFDIFGQPGCWQDACCLAGTQRMILLSYDDPGWVHEFLSILKRRKIGTIRTMKGARFDINELGGGDASTTVISPELFRRFVAPYDIELIREAHQAGQRIVYHICGGLMPILEDIVDMGPDAVETFTPTSMGGDADLKAAKKRIGDRVCLIGGFDQFHHFIGCSPQETRAAVRRCFQEAGENGGYILSTSDHFFEADLELIEVYADEARTCIY